MHLGNAHLLYLIDCRDNRSDDLPVWAVSIIHILEAIMNDQDRLNTTTLAFNETLGNIEANVADLKAQVAASTLDFTALDLTLARARAIVSAGVVPAPVDVPPVDPNAPPVDPNSPPVDVVPVDPSEG